MTTDPIADMLTRVRNACRAGHRKVDVPSSTMKREIARILKERGFVHNYAHIEDNRQGYLRLYLKYSSDEESAIQGLKRESRPRSEKIRGQRRNSPHPQWLGRRHFIHIKRRFDGSRGAPRRRWRRSDLQRLVRRRASCLE